MGEGCDFRKPWYVRVDGRGIRLGRFVHVVGWVTLTAFSLECVIKIVAQGARPARYFTHADDGGFNCFDFTVVAISWALMGSAAGEIVAVCR